MSEAGTEGRRQGERERERERLFLGLCCGTHQALGYGNKAASVGQHQRNLAPLMFWEGSSC